MLTFNPKIHDFSITPRNTKCLSLKNMTRAQYLDFYSKRTISPLQDIPVVSPNMMGRVTHQL